MRLALLSLACVFVGSLFLVPIPVRGEHGAYNSWSRIAWCDNDHSCLHEIGHGLDQQAGWVSQSPEFAEAVRLYIVAGILGQEELPVYMLAMTYTAPDGQEPTKKELYANLYMLADGKAENMPEGLRKFFDWQTGNEYAQMEGEILWLVK